MSIKDFLKRKAAELREANKPENVEKRLKAEIKKEKLKTELEDIKEKRRKKKEEKYKNIKWGM